jgi:glucose/mannose transport system substrate-binding protein
MRKGSIRLIAAASVIALAITGCSSSSDDAANTDTEFEIFKWWASGGEAAGLQALVDLYKEQNPETDFINASVAGGAGVNAKAVLESRMSAGDAPDSFQAHAGLEVIASYAAQGKLEDLSSLYQSEGWDKSFPADLIKQTTLDGKIYSVPVNIHRANVLWWNPATAAKAGITKAPTTLDEMFADLEKFKKAGVKTPMVLAGGEGSWAMAHLLDYVLVASMGPEKFEGLFTGSTSWTGAEVTEAIKVYQRLLSYGDKGKNSFGWGEAGAAITKGTGGFFIMGDWASAQWQNEGSVLGTDYTFAAGPGTVGIYQWLSDTFTLPVGAKNRNASLEWLKLSGSKEGQDAFNPLKGSIAARTDSDLSLYDDYLKSAAADWKKDRLVGSTAHGVTADNKFMAAMNAAVGKYVSGGAKDNAGLAKDLAAAQAAVGK